MVGVSPDHRGKGIGRRLVVACIDLARERGQPGDDARHQRGDGRGATAVHVARIRTDRPTRRPGGPELLGYRLDIPAQSGTTR